LAKTHVLVAAAVAIIAYLYKAEGRRSVAAHSRQWQESARSVRRLSLLRLQPLERREWLHTRQISVFTA
jgi:hypothetical protein